VQVAQIDPRPAGMATAPQRPPGPARRPAVAEDGLARSRHAGQGSYLSAVERPLDVDQGTLRPVEIEGREDPRSWRRRGQSEGSRPPGGEDRRLDPPVVVPGAGDQVEHLAQALRPLAQVDAGLGPAEVERDPPGTVFPVMA